METDKQLSDHQRKQDALAAEALLKEDEALSWTMEEIIVGLRNTRDKEAREVADTLASALEDAAWFLAKHEVTK